ncbi:hypothetical protein QTP81_02685 [Alteromonas sp. ASW11-36]|uniref:Glycine zipper 2TM domain-containing protein n=1 Tax=Alteromonas arenosi TaxID=3055817 RepID=A0ABT7STJ2_9ALTE|nr:hypothetical protein [Alteromonas sp. ASW11-36]MDM7859511.1 hypothetical protein [Alteromonas sp. ASW11-36]
MQNNTLQLASIISILMLLSGCAHSGYYARQEANQFVTEFYAWVDDIETVRFDSNVEENMLIGATHGAVSWGYYDSHDALQGAIWGGLLAGLITAAIEGDNEGYEYQLSAVDGDYVTVLTDSRDAVLGDCVRVRVAEQVRIYPVAAEYCVSDVM